jgi:hypothetical protein
MREIYIMKQSPSGIIRRTDLDNTNDSQKRSIKCQSDKIEYPSKWVHWLIIQSIGDRIDKLVHQ